MDNGKGQVEKEAETEERVPENRKGWGKEQEKELRASVLPAPKRHTMDQE